MTALRCFILVQLAAFVSAGPCEDCRTQLAKRTWTNQDAVTKTPVLLDVLGHWDRAIKEFEACETTADCKDLHAQFSRLHRPFYEEEALARVMANQECFNRGQAKAIPRCSAKNHDILGAHVDAGQDPLCPIIVGLYHEFSCGLPTYAEECGEELATAFFGIVESRAKELVIDFCDKGHCLPTHEACQALAEPSTPDTDEKEPKAEGKGKGKGKAKAKGKQNMKPKLPVLISVPDGEQKFYCAANVGICQPCTGYDCTRYAQKTFDSAGDCVRQSACQTAFVEEVSSKVLTYKTKPVKDVTN